MKQQTINWQALNAYIDGELSPPDAAKVARAVMLDKRLAAQVARLTRLKAVTSELAPCGESFTLPEPVESPSWYSRAAIWLLVPLLGLLFGAVTMMQRQADPVLEAELARAEKAHYQWLNADVSDARREDSGKALKTTLDDIGPDVYIPDLSKVDLHYAGVHRMSAETKKGITDGIHVGYLGSSGCKVSLVISQDAVNRSMPLRMIDHRGHSIYQWRIGHTGYSVLGSRMDPGRLDKIVHVLYYMTRERMPLDIHAVLALNQAKMQGAPCSV